MQHAGLDLFSYGGKQYLICVDHWSGYPLYSPLRSLSSESITTILATWFNTLGWPLEATVVLNFVDPFPPFVRSTTFIMSFLHRTILRATVSQKLGLNA